MKALWRAAVQAHAWLYKLTGGRLGGGDSVLLLTTTGRKTGKRRTNPLMRIEDGSNYLVAASAGGSKSHPDWFYNLAANPNVVVQVEAAVEPRRARIAGGEERMLLYRRFVERDARFGKYEARTDREIPVVVLEPVP